MGGSGRLVQVTDERRCFHFICEIASLLFSSHISVPKRSVRGEMNKQDLPGNFDSDNNNELASLSLVVDCCVPPLTLARCY